MNNEFDIDNAELGVLTYFIDLKKESIDEYYPGLLQFLHEISQIHEESFLLTTFADSINYDTLAYNENLIFKEEPGIQHNVSQLPSLSLDINRNITQIRNYFRYEYARYKYYKEKHTLSPAIEETLSKIILENHYLNRRSHYPIRERIRNIILNFSQKMKNESIEFNYHNELFKKHINNVAYPTWYTSTNNMNMALHLFMKYYPGSSGHLLWLLLYISELCYFQSKHTSNSLINSIISENWYTAELNDEALDILFSDFIEYTKYRNDEITFYLKNRRTDLSYSTYDDIYQNMKSVLFRDPMLRRIFVDTNNISDPPAVPPSSNQKHTPQRCFAILASKSQKYVAISGYDFKLFNYMKTIFLSKTSNANAYIFLDTNEYIHSLYMWDYHGLPYEMKQSCAKRKISNHGIKTDYPYKRMYSCAERRLVKKYLVYCIIDI